MGLILWTPDTLLGRLSAFWQSYRDNIDNPYSHVGVVIIYGGTLYYTDSNYESVDFYEVVDFKEFFDTDTTIYWLDCKGVPGFLIDKMYSSTNTSKLDLLRIALGDTPKGDVCTTYAAKVFDIYNKEIATARQVLLAVSERYDILFVQHVIADTEVTYYG